MAIATPLLCSSSSSLLNTSRYASSSSSSPCAYRLNFISLRVRAVKGKTQEEVKTSSSSSSSAEEITKKYGLEVGLWKVICNLYPTSSRWNFTGFYLSYSVHTVWKIGLMIF